MIRRLLPFALAGLLLSGPLLSGCSYFEDDEEHLLPRQAGGTSSEAAGAPAATTENPVPSASAVPAASVGPSENAGPTAPEIPSASGAQAVPSASSSAVPVDDTTPKHRIRGLVLAKGRFSTIAGSVAVIEAGKGYAVSFASDFDAGDIDIEDIVVGLGREGQIVADARLGALKKASGAQFYLVPLAVDVSAFTEVHLANAETGASIAAAELGPGY
jgi:hypothetical protein